jgi:quercetin dioxygenase-like cupin family protein
MAHIVKLANELDFVTPGIFEGRSKGFTSAVVVDEAGGGIQMGFRITRLEPGGRVEPHVHSYEESVYVTDGSLVIDTMEGATLLVSGDYGLIPVGMTHALRNASDATVEFAVMQAPIPRERFGFDTQFPEVIGDDFGSGTPRPIDVRDPRTRSYGHIDAESMDPALQTQDRLAVSASMRTALLVYSGISVKMMVDADLGADLSTMFMVQYEPGGFAGAHDHPLEEAYLILEGEVEGAFDGSTYRLGPGDVAWAGVGCVHEFRNIGAGRVRWLETQAPQPPKRRSYRFARDWSYLADLVGADRSQEDTT